MFKELKVLKSSCCLSFAWLLRGYLRKAKNLSECVDTMRAYLKTFNVHHCSDFAVDLPLGDEELVSSVGSFEVVDAPERESLTLTMELSSVPFTEGDYNDGKRTFLSSLQGMGGCGKSF